MTKKSLLLQKWSSQRFEEGGERLHKHRWKNPSLLLEWWFWDQMTCGL